jgi:hypothetical protein
MAQRKARKGGSKARTAARKRPVAKKKPARRAVAGGAAATRRVAQLEAENRRLRDELAALRAQQAESAIAGDSAAESPSTLPL